MTNKISRSELLSVGAATLLAAGSGFAFAAGQLEPEAIMKKMMEATKNGAYEDFLVDCDDQMKAALTKQMFEGVSGVLGPRLRQGWKHVYLGKLRQQGHTVHLWRLEFADGKDDHLVKLSLKDGKVSGIIAQ